MHRRSAVILSVVLVAASFGPADAGEEADRRTSPTYFFATYMEERGPVLILVDALPAAYHETDPYVPVPVAVGVRGYGRITVSPESFSLEDAAGFRTPAASYSEVAEHDSKILFDLALTRGRPVTAQAFELGRRQPSRFYTPGSGRRIERVQLDAYTWFRDVIFFPRPPGGLEGVLTLRFRPEGLDEPLEVRFRIPETRFRRR